MDVDWEEICKVFVVLGGGAASVALTPAALAALGFTSTGVAAGSVGAKLMSYFAIANGGGVAAGGLVATAQSWAMGGLTGVATGGLGGAGAGLGWVLSRICNQTGTH
ncbi:interferon alpha-inducible protein 27-like protein 2A [Archocentrus centrarchus]|uniref:interferon alpha-inducible protein 27-like protein 2A n=1 Tax=Archocentrus centrarchus TaxID=63155 RepID=UPI0011E9DCFD|nr:interferon alpha-inducible protein 27-like protein 2A [Archocentrus centrarchus]XP_030575235.1 interferon alpha-inducible protein 27-like protein 2A [Archocentrus centrarchus]